MAGQNLRLVQADVSKSAFESFGNARVQCASWLSQERSVGRILHQCVLEQISGIGRYALPEQQTRGNDAVECRAKDRLGLLHHSR